MTPGTASSVCCSSFVSPAPPVMQSFSLAPPHLCAPAPISKGFEIFKGYGDRGKVMGGRGRRRRPPFFHTCLQPFTPVMFCGRVFYTRRDVGSGCCAEKRWGRGRWGGGGQRLGGPNLMATNTTSIILLPHVSESLRRPIGSSTCSQISCPSLSHPSSKPFPSNSRPTFWPSVSQLHLLFSLSL